MPQLSQDHVSSQSCSFLLGSDHCICMCDTGAQGIYILMDSQTLLAAYTCVIQKHKAPIPSCNSQTQSAACARVIQQQGTHTLVQQPHTVSCICMCDTGAKGTHTLMQQPHTVSCISLGAQLMTWCNLKGYATCCYQKLHFFVQVLHI